MELMLDSTDRDLLRAGDTESLVRRYYGAVYGLVRRLLGSEADARDAAQETFTRAILHLNQFTPERSFRDWLFTIATNHVRDLFRRKRESSLHAGTQDTLPDLMLPDEPILRRENRARILAAVDRLPLEWKIVVTLHFLHELPYPAIADVLGVSVNAVRIRLYRAFAVLRKDLS
jgi:RNA polymerase sigma-70 factor (ECF subfamily)